MKGKEVIGIIGAGPGLGTTTAIMKAALEKHEIIIINDIPPVSIRNHPPIELVALPTPPRMTGKESRRARRKKNRKR